MTAADPRSVESIFVALAPLGPADRAASLDRICGSDADLRREVESLLQFHDAPQGALDQSPLLSLSAGLASIAAADEAVLPPKPEAAGYTLTSVLGSGGMGVVYVAEQHRPRRTVALKVIRRSSAHADMLRRFEHEAEVLARLQHPGIAQIFEAGVADFGHGQQPFIAMELVRGPNLVQAAREGQYSTRKRLEVVACVCDAVQHAHQRGVIHRDLKPANILVVEQEPLPQPKILDFGVSRVTDADVQVTLLHTGVGQLIGTLPYMSPEQVAGDPREIDTRCDVYALGVVLYELLAGRLPHDVSSRSIPEAARMIREDAPPRLSAIKAVFRGDIDTIVCKALEKDPARRYQSAAELGADLRRFLSDEPIVARRASALYQFRKFAERNKRFIAAVAIGVMLLLATSLVSLIFGLQALTARRAAVVSQAAAESRGRAAIAEAEKARWAAYLANITAAQSAIRANDTFAARRRLDAIDPSFRSSFEWRYLKARLDDSLATLSGPELDAALALSPDGTLLATGGSRGQVFIWNTEMRDIPVSLAQNASVVALAFAPDGSSLASLGNDGHVQVWNVALPGPHLTPRATLHTSAGQARSITFSADGQWLLIVPLDKPLQIFEIDSGRLIQEFTDDAPSHAAAISRDRALLATAHMDRFVRVRNLHGAGAQPAAVQLPTVARFMCFDPEGKRLLVAGSDHTLTLLDAQTVQVIRQIRGHQDEVTWCAFNSAGDELYSASHDGTVRIWSASTGDELGLLRGSGGAIVRASASGDCGLIATLPFDQRVRLFDASVARDNAAINCGARNLLAAVAFSPDSTRFATGAVDGVVRVWRADSATLVAELPGHTELVHALAFTPDGRRLVSGSFDGTVRVWNMHTGACEAVFRGHEDDVFGVAISPDGRTAASASEDSTIRVWDLDTRQQIASISGHRGAVRAVAFSPDGRLLASSGADRTVRLWDASTHEARRTFTGHRMPVTGLAFSPRGNFLASASDDHSARLWDVDSGEAFGAPLSHADGVTTVAFSPDGSRLITGGSDMALHIWEIPSGEEVTVLRGHRYPIICVALAPDGTRIVSGSLDKWIRLWEVAPLSGRSEARRQRQAFEPKARDAVDAALTAANGDFQSAAEAIVDDPAMDEQLRQAAMDEFLRRGAERWATESP